MRPLSDVIPSHLHPRGPALTAQSAPERELCGAHPHHAHHHGELDIVRTPEGNLRFVGEDGTHLGTVTGGHWRVPKSRAGP